jgi:hypothetical protein
MKVTAGPKHSSNWNIKVFEHSKDNRYVLHEENIREVSFPARDILAVLKVHFREVEIVDPDHKQPSTHSERLFFICKRRTQKAH